MVNVGKYIPYKDGMGHEEISCPQNSPSPVFDEILRYPKHANTDTGSRCLGKNIPQANALSIRTWMFSGVGEPRNISEKKNTSCDAGLVVVSSFKYFLVSPLPMEMIRFDLRISFKWLVQP